MNRMIPFALGLFFFVAAAAAGELDPKTVPDDVNWLIHVDVERLLDSTVGRQIIEHADDLDIDLDDLEDMKEEVGIDPFRDIYSLTLHGHGDPDEDMTVIAVMSPKIDEVIAHIRHADEYKRLTVNGHTVHRWDDGDPTYIHVRAADRGDRRLVVISGRKARVRDVLNVLEGEHPNIEESMDEDDDSASIDALPRSGSLLFAYARGLPWLANDDDPASAIVRRSNRLLLELREKNDRTMLDVAISARTRRDATNIGAVLKGVIALGDLLADNEPDLDELAEILRAIRIDAKENDIKLHIELDSTEFVEQLGNVSGHM